MKAKRYTFNLTTGRSGRFDIICLHFRDAGRQYNAPAVSITWQSNPNDESPTGWYGGRLTLEADSVAAGAVILAKMAKVLDGSRIYNNPAETCALLESIADEADWDEVESLWKRVADLPPAGAVAWMDVQPNGNHTVEVIADSAEEASPALLKLLAQYPAYLKAWILSGEQVARGRVQPARRPTWREVLKVATVPA